MVDGDYVVRALLTAVATLGDMVDLDQDSSMALNALEGIAYQLSLMDSDERVRLLDALGRIALGEQEPDHAEWIRNLPASLGLRWPESDSRGT